MALVHVDFAGPIYSLSFLVVMDAHSKWPEIFLMKNADTHSTITVLKWLFSQHGLPETLVLDSGRQFSSELVLVFAGQVAYHIFNHHPMTHNPIAKQNFL